jgi:hypothetical protein
MLGDEFVTSGEGLREDLGGGGVEGGVHAFTKSKDPTTCRDRRLSGRKSL